MTLFHVFLDFLEAEDGMERTRDFRWPPAGRKWPRRCVKNFPRWLGFRCASHGSCLNCLNCLMCWNPRGLHIPTLESMCESSRGYGCTLHHEHQYCRDGELCVSTSSWECRCCAFVAPKKHPWTGVQHRWTVFFLRATCCWHGWRWMANVISTSTVVAASWLSFSAPKKKVFFFSREKNPSHLGKPESHQKCQTGWDTPWKINMEPQNEGLIQMILLFKQVIFRFPWRCS